MLHSVVIPAIVLSSINAYNLWTEHWEHWEHLPPLEERPQYPYQNIRSKNFFWGDGDKVRYPRNYGLGVLLTYLHIDFVVSHQTLA
jgi:hypothetical protein